jgi:CubicO group peptidase (beta-lactamase class C family)
MYAAGELGMTASDLARWDISLMNDTILKPSSLKELTTEVHLKNGAGTGYALGLGVSNRNGHRKWAHGGGADGFISENFTLPDDKISVTVLTNQEDPAAHQIATDIEGILIAPPVDPEAPAALERVRGIFAGLQNGKLDRSLLSDDGNAYFTPAVIADFEKSLKPLGAPVAFKQSSMSLRGGMVFRSFSMKTASKALLLTTFALGDGKLAQYMIYPAEGK